jgi:RNase P subunit RPR2
MTIVATKKTLNFWEYGSRSKVPYCAKCRSFEGVECEKRDDGLIRIYFCPQCQTKERYEHVAKGHYDRIQTNHF